MRRNATVKTIRKNEKRGDAHFGIASRHINKCLLIGEYYRECRVIKITQLETKNTDDENRRFLFFQKVWTLRDLCGIVPGC